MLKRNVWNAFLLNRNTLSFRIMFGAKEIASVAAVHKEATASWFFRQRFRFYVLVLTTACLTSILANMLSVNTTINCMDPSRNSVCLGL